MSEDRLKNAISHLRTRIADLSARSNNIMDNEEIKELIHKEFDIYASDEFFTFKEKQEVVYHVYNSLRGLGTLQPLLDDKSITEIMINGTDEIFVEKAGRITQLEEKFRTTEELENIIQNIVGKVNRSVNESSPIVDARLVDGSRVNVVLPPIALKGPTMTIRKFPEVPMTMDRLVGFGSLPESIAEKLEQIVRGKMNIFISGGTGSGKTSFLNALSNFIPADERIITIEDSAELQIINIPNLVSLETRDANTEGIGEISMRDLIKSSLRMRPDRIVVGEVRGKEALEMLQAMNTGHDGSLSTGHANNVKDMLSRLETMVLSGAPLPLDAIRQQIASAIDIIVHLGRLRDKSRRVLEITEVLTYEGGVIDLNPLYKFEEDEGSTDDKVIGCLKHQGNQIINDEKIRMAGIKLRLGDEI